GPTPRFRTIQVCAKDLPAHLWQAERAADPARRGLYLPALAALKKRGARPHGRRETTRFHDASRRAGGGGESRLYDIGISLKNLRHHWNARSRTSAAGVSDLPSVIHSSAACAPYR